MSKVDELAEMIRRFVVDPPPTLSTEAMEGFEVNGLFKAIEAAIDERIDSKLCEKGLEKMGFRKESVDDG